MDAGTTSAYRNRKRPLDGRPCNPKAKRRLFPAAKVHRGPLNRRRLLIVQAARLAVATAVAAYCLAARRSGCSDQELAPLVESLRGLASDMSASAAVGAPVEDEAGSGRVE